MKISISLLSIAITFLLATLETAIWQTNAVANAQTYSPSNRTPVADSTMNTQVGVNGSNFNITGGVNKGQTLFHSFTDFSVPTNGAANFNNPVGNRDIITRVTGTNFSDINGLINSNGANFFLINPNGVVFGTNAQLNVGKAFMATTANSIDLVDGSGRAITFGTNSNGDAALLSVAPNVLFNVSKLTLGGGNVQISNFGTLQTTNDSQYIGLVGGNVNINGGKIIAPGGRVDIGGLNSTGTVGVGTNGLVFDGSGSSRSDVTLANGASISVRANQTLNPVDPIWFGNATSPGSSINISANRIEIANSGTRFIPTANNVNRDLGGLDAGLEVNSGAKTGTIGNISLDATGDITLQTSSIVNLVRSGAEGTGGSIKIAGNNITVTNKSEISTNLSRGAVGKGGNIDIIALGNFSLVNANYPDAQTTLINSNAETISDSLIAASSYGRGNSGKIQIAAGGSVTISDGNALATTVAPTGVGSSGGIKINASSFLLKNGSQIVTTAAEATTSQGTAKNDTGNVEIATTGDLTIFGGNVITGGGNVKTRLALITTNNFRTGDSGNISLSTPGKLSIVNRGAIVSSIGGKNGNGNSNGIKIVAGEILLSNLSEISSSLGVRRNDDTKGTAGNIDINATGDITIDESLDRLVVKEFEGSKDTPSVIANSVNGIGKGGKITINTAGKVTVGNHNGILSTVEPGGEGDPGGIVINAGELEVYNEGQILTVASTFSRGKRGNAGNIDIKTTGNITIAGNRNKDLAVSPAAIANNGKSDKAFAKIASNSFRNGNAGKITLDAGGDIFIINKGGISTRCEELCRSQVLGNKAGNINLNSDRLIFDRGDISLNATDNAGDISIVTRDSMVMRRNSSIATNSNVGGNGGNIRIDSPFVVAVPNENSDITASAIRGRGGSVNIDAQGIFGIQFRPLRTSFSDIIVSSEFGQSGTANIDTPGTDPGRDTTELPNTTLDASNQISPTCSAATRENKLTVAGRGGLPADANDPLNSDVVWQDARANTSQPVTDNAPANRLPPPAVGMVFNGKKVTLIAAKTPAQQVGKQIVCPK